MKTVRVLVVVCVIFSTIGSILVVGESNASYYYPRPWGPFIFFNSPANDTYLSEANGNTLTLDINVGTITFAEAPGETYILTYSLDGKPYQSLPTVYEGIFGDHNTMSHSVNTGHTSLPYLPEGNHTITAHCVLEVDNGTFSEELKTYFTVDNTAPHILIQSLANKTYDTTSLPLNFTVNEPFNSLSYSLDGNQSIEIEGNTTLAGLTSGSHSVTVYAVDRAGNIGKSETIYFTISLPSQYDVAILSIVVAVVLCLCLLFYLKRYNVRKIRGVDCDLL